jgi:hypothetical protein
MGSGENTLLIGSSPVVGTTFDKGFARFAGFPGYNCQTPNPDNIPRRSSPADGADSYHGYRRPYFPVMVLIIRLTASIK